MKPKRSDDKYWKGTRDFNHIQFEDDLEEYIYDLMNKSNEVQLLKFAEFIASDTNNLNHTPKEWVEMFLSFSGLAKWLNPMLNRITKLKN